MEFNTTEPIYIQIANKIKEQIISGSIQPGEKLPSVREYSVMYEVSALTMQRTMQFMEQENIITSKKGIGSFVREDLGQRLQQQMIDVQIDGFITKMQNCGLTNTEILTLIEQRLKEADQHE